MKRYTIFIALALAIGLAFWVGRISNAPSTSATDAASEAPAEDTRWTCSMHPSIITPDPGLCPICAMDLIPLRSGDSATAPGSLKLSANAQALANIQTTVVERRFPVANIRLTGRIDFDETRLRSLTARFPARIDELFVNFTGIRVQKGDHLARIYSPELLTAQRELLTAASFNPDSPAAQSARQKLLLWDLLPAQVDEIIASGAVAETLELKAPIGGVVVSKNVKEGDYLQTGQPLFRIADLSRLWLYLDAYESDLPWLHYGQTVEFTTEALPGETFSGKIVFINPVVDEQTRTVRLRVDVENPDAKLKPGMYAKAIVESRIAANGETIAPEYAGKWISPMHPEIVKDQPGICDVCGMPLVPADQLGIVSGANEQAPLVIPTTAVLRTGKRAVVYVMTENDDSGATFKGRVIALGPRAGDVFIVAAGLEEGERVVKNGAFRLDSELQIMAQHSMMNPDPNAALPMVLPLIEPAALSALLPLYLDLQDALAADDEEKSIELAAKLGVAANSQTLPTEADTTLRELAAAADIEGIRRPHFDLLSQIMLKSLQAHPEAAPAPLYVMNCPMVYDNQGADWLQRGPDLLNPYFGAMMLRCGDNTGMIEPSGSAAPIKQEASSDAHTGHSMHHADDHLHAPQIKLLLPLYLDLQDALAADDEQKSIELAAKLGSSANTANLSSPILQVFQDVAAQTDIEGIRRPHFDLLSQIMIQSVRLHPEALGQPLHLMNCPMVYGETGADWLQRGPDLLNPYFGAMMLRCGSSKGLIEPAK